MTTQNRCALTQPKQYERVIRNILLYYLKCNLTFVCLKILTMKNDVFLKLCCSFEVPNRTRHFDRVQFVVATPLFATRPFRDYSDFPEGDVAAATC